MNDLMEDSEELAEYCMRYIQDYRPTTTVDGEIMPIHGQDRQLLRLAKKVMDDILD
jgi:hypothetical protein